MVELLGRGLGFRMFLWSRMFFFFDDIGLCWVEFLVLGVVCFRDEVGRGFLVIEG